jgi:PAS domain-containing protein
VDGSRAALGRAKARLDRLSLYERPVRIERVRIVGSRWLFRLPWFRRFDGYAMWNLILLCSPELCAGRGPDLPRALPRWQMEHRPLRMPLSDLSDEQQAQVRDEAAESGRWRGEAEVERKDGSIVSVEAIAVAIRDRDGEITGYLAIHRDITERKRSEEALREAQRRAETILDSITDEFFVLDSDWLYT